MGIYPFFKLTNNFLLNSEVQKVEFLAIFKIFVGFGLFATAKPNPHLKVYNFRINPNTTNDGFFSE